MAVIETLEGYDVVAGNEIESNIIDGQLALDIKVKGCPVSTISFPVIDIPSMSPEITVNNTQDLTVKQGHIIHLPITVTDQDQNLDKLVALATHKQSGLKKIIGEHDFSNAEHYANALMTP